MNMPTDPGRDRADPPRPLVPEALQGPGIVAIGRRIEPSAVAALIDGLRRGGVRAFELTLNEPEPEALRAIEAAARHASGDEVAIGAGTVLSIEAARRALDAGAAFLVMPHTDAELIHWAAERSVPAFPGATTPTEILLAWRSGAAAVKLFPASVVGAGFIREFRGPFPEIPLVPTGGVTADTAGDFIRSGAIAVGLGGWLLGDGSPDGVERRAAQVVAAVAVARS